MAFTELFQGIVSRNVSNAFTVAGSSVRSCRGESFEGNIAYVIVVHLVFNSRWVRFLLVSGGFIEE
jgi:hypothetical protein